MTMIEVTAAHHAWTVARGLAPRMPPSGLPDFVREAIVGPWLTFLLERMMHVHVRKVDLC